MIFSHVVAMSKNRIIGNKTLIPWDLPEDRKFFRKLTTGHPVLMGRKTFESIVAVLKKPLPNRDNYVISKSLKEAPAGVVSIFSSADSAIGYLTHMPADEVFIIGGGEVYSKTVNIVQKIYLTLIDKDFEGDTFYPEIPDTFKETKRESFTNPFPYSFITLEKK